MSFMDFRFGFSVASAKLFLDIVLCNVVIFCFTVLCAPPEAQGLFFLSVQALADDVFHLVPLGKHIPAQSDLAAGAHQIVVGARDLKIGVSPQVVIQEPDRQFRRQAEAADGQGVGLGIRHGTGSHFQKAFGKCPEYLQVHLCLLRVGAVLLHLVGGKPDSIAEVMSHKARHDRIQVNDHQRPVVLGTKENVIDLGVVVGHPQGKLSLQAQIRQRTGKVLHAEQILDLPAYLPDTSGFVFRDSLAEHFIPLAGIVETGDRLMQGSDVKIGKLVLKLAESPSGVADDLGILNGIIGDRGDKIGHPPEIVAVLHIGLPVISMMKMEAKLSGALAADMLRHLVNILHQAHRIPERVGVYILHQKGLGPAVCQEEIHLIGLVYVAHLNGFVSHIGVLDAEAPAHFC